MKSLGEWANEIANWREQQGFPCPISINQVEETLAKLMLIVTEISEAAEAVRIGNEENFKEELADAIIRILDLVGTMLFDIETAMEKKMQYNRSRPLKHNKKA